jgi:hypothetical protein
VRFRPTLARPCTRNIESSFLSLSHSGTFLLPLPSTPILGTDAHMSMAVFYSVTALEAIFFLPLAVNKMYVTRKPLSELLSSSFVKRTNLPPACAISVRTGFPPELSQITFFSQRFLSSQHGPASRKSCATWRITN